VIAVVGDGSMAISAMELLTAVRERLALTVILFNDASLGLIRVDQLTEYGHAHGTELLNPDFHRLCDALSLRYVRLAASRNGPSVEEQLQDALTGDGVTVVEVRLRESMMLKRRQIVACARATARSLVRAAAPSIVQRWAKVD
jgi:thiamine pyrophosphate-dependent acetolactate synthase large subunit-like protein